MSSKILVSMTTLTLVGALTGCSSQNNSQSNSPSGNQKSVSPWLSVDTSNKTARLNLEAEYKKINGGFNFDGYSNGNMIVTIPKGWNVKVSFSNDSTDDSHSAMIVPYSDRQATSLNESSVAFKGASTPNPLVGVMKETNQQFSFITDKTGKYAFVCGVPGHDSAGMWDTLIVSDSATTTSISIQK